MDIRHIVAYALIAVIITALAGAWRYATREQRWNKQAVGRANRRRKERLAAENGE